MPENQKVTGFERAFGDARSQAGKVANEVTGAAQGLYDQARDSAAQVADTTTKAAKRTAGSFEKALRDTIENQPYTAVANWCRARLAVRPDAPAALTGAELLKFPADEPIERPASAAA